jgi:hypothetical protein
LLNQKCSKEQIMDRNCLTCGAHLNMHRGTTEPAIPKEGDICLCAYCGGLHKFKEDFKLRALTMEELSAVMKSEDWPMIKKLQSRPPGKARTEDLGTLAFKFRGTRDENLRRDIAFWYGKIMEQLQRQGGAEFPGPEDLLPDEYMPKDWWKHWNDG